MSGLRFGVVLATAVVLVGATARAGVTPQQKCAVAKLKASGKRAAAGLGCWSKAVAGGVGVDASCLAGASTKLDAAFAKAEASGACLIAGDAGATAAAIDAVVATLVDLLPGGGTPDGRTCAAAKLAAAGKSAAAGLGCAAKAGATGATIDPTCTAAVDTKLSVAFAKQEGKRACVTAGDASAVATTIDGWVASLAVALTSTTTTTVTTTTTTTVTTSTTTTTGASTTSTTAAPGTFASVQQIFTASCALPQCHEPPVPAQDLDLTAGVSYAQLVDVASGEKPAVLRVKPADEKNSYLWRKVNNSGNFLGARMPNNGLVLSATDLASIKQWILAGAPAN